MNISHEAYESCHAIMLENPNYMPTEGAGVTYIMVQVSDLPEQIGIQAMLINPAVPDKGNIKHFLDLTDDQQVAALALPRVAKTIVDTHELIQKLKKMSNDKENIPEVIKSLEKALNQSPQGA